MFSRYVIISVAFLILASSPSSSDHELKENLSKFSHALRLVRTEFVDTVNTHELIISGIQGMLGHLDPHSDFLDEETTRKMHEEHRGSFHGVGMTISVQTGWLTVVSPIDETPAARAGIMAGDRIIKIDGVSSKGISSDEAAELIRGPKGTTVTLTILREGIDEEMEFVLERAKIPIASLNYAFHLRPGIGYMRLTRFAKTSADELEEAKNQLIENGPLDALILDLRMNSGGLLSAAVDVSDRFIGNDNLIVYTAGRMKRSNHKELGTTQNTWPNWPLIVLVDRGSASASEIVAGAVQDWDRGFVIGRTTFGKGLVQNLYELSGGNALKITTARYYTPSGRSIQRDYESTRVDYYRNAGKNNGDDDRPVVYSYGGRPLKAGGGIVPDVIVDKPTQLTREEALAQRKGILFQTASHYLGLHPDLRNAYDSFSDFNTDYAVDSALADTLHRTLINEGIIDSIETWERVRENFLFSLKAELAGHIWSPTEKYRIIIERDNDILEALRHIDDAKSLLDPESLPGRPESADPWPSDRLDISGTT